MNEAEGFDADWLALRESFDARARSARLAALLSAALPARPRLLDLGAGTGSLLRWLAPRIGRAQAWTLVDADAALIEEAFATIADHAEARGMRATFPNRRTLLVHAPGGAWRVEGLVTDLADAPRRLPLVNADAVLSSALCDLVSEEWVERMAAALGVPFYAALCVDGRDRFSPPHRADAMVAAGFRRDQGRDKGFGGPSLGPRAPEAIARHFAARGFAVESAPSDWVVRSREAPREEAEEFLTRLVLGHAAAAEAQHRGLRAGIDAWSAARLGQARARILAARIGHRDLLALPPARRG